MQNSETNLRSDEQKKYSYLFSFKETIIIPAEHVSNQKAPMQEVYMQR